MHIQIVHDYKKPAFSSDDENGISNEDVGA